MDTNKMRDISREQFEARYPVPEGACWNAEQGRYVLFHLKLCTVAKYERFVENWVCWQASREAVVVELPAAEFGVSPEIQGDEEYESAEAISMCEDAVLSRVRKHIEAQGLKVAP